MIDSDFRDETKAPLERVLLVDDEALSVKEMTSALKSRDFKVSVVKDAAQALAALRMRPSDIVISKIILPGESGFELCEKVKQQHERVPFLMYTEVDLESAHNLAQRVGADGYLVKPSEEDELFEVMREVVDAVWERVLHQEKEKGQIRFRCSCGQRMKESFQNRGKYATCTTCHERVLIPNQTLHQFVTRQKEKDDSESQQLQPLKFVTVKCSSCSTFYRLANVEGDWRKCPHCGVVETRSLSIVGAPMSRAALESSLRVLRILNGKSKGKKLMLPEREIVFGRATECDIRHGSKSVGDRHCKLEPTPQGIRVQELGSGKGTFIDGNAVEGKAIVPPGSILRIGELQFRLIGEDLSVDQELQRVQKWSENEKKYRDRGIRVIESGKETAAEAAQVIQQHWNITRKRRVAEPTAE